MTINYIEKGIELHDTILAAGYWLRHENGIWISSNDAAVQAIINSFVNIPGKIKDLENQYTTRLDAGKLYSVTNGIDSTQHNYQIDEVPPFNALGIPIRRDSQSTITTMGTWARNVLDGKTGVAAWPTNFAWRDYSNKMVPMTAQQCWDFSQNIAAYVAALDANYFTLWLEINACTTQDQITAIDITQNWPSNP